MLPRALACLLTCCLLLPALQAQRVVKILDDFEQFVYASDPYSKTPGSTAPSTETPEDVYKSKQALEFTVSYAASGGFSWHAILRKEPIVIAGHCESVTFWAKTDNPRVDLKAIFRDGWGKKRKGLDAFLQSQGVWEQVTVDIPLDWPQPVTFIGFASDNWPTRESAEPLTGTFQIDDLRTVTYIDKVDPETGKLTDYKVNPEPPEGFVEPAAKLVQVEVSTTAPGNTYTLENPAVLISARSWQRGKLPMKIHYRVVSHDGQLIEEQELEEEVRSTKSLRIEPKVPRYGLYEIEVKVSAKTYQSQKHMSFAWLPAQSAPNEAQRLSSPYGLNIHSFRKLLLEPFRQAGVYWYRDYGFDFGTMQRAQDEQGKFTRWPHYEQTLKIYREAGVEVMPVLKGAMSRLTEEQAKAGKAPRLDPTWKAKLTHIFKSFPTIRLWELDNEYDLLKETAIPEKSIEWRHYGQQHQQFAEAIKEAGVPGLRAVENGNAGIFTERTRLLVERGDFAGIDALNVHHYTGMEAPEVNYTNHNAWAESHHRYTPPMLLYDELRKMREVAYTDGRSRELYLTEVGWDTKAGPYVSHEQQAAYLPRAFMLAIAAGVNRTFWFFDFDNPTSDHYFDGCGLLTHDFQPKLSLCSLAGLTYALPNPRFIGTINAGEDSWGYLFDRDGYLVASLFSISGKRKPKVKLEADVLLDAYGNPLPSLETELDIAPIYALGIQPTSSWYKQTAYSLYTPYLEVVPAGGTISAQLLVSNNRTEPIRGEVQIQLPRGFKAEPASFMVDVPVGQALLYPVRIKLPLGSQLGESQLYFKVNEADFQKTIPLRVLVQSAFDVRVEPLKGREGPTELKVSVKSRLSGTHDGILELNLPKSWKADPPVATLTGLKKHESQETSFQLDWDTHWQRDEQAKLTFLATDGSIIEKSILPNAYRIPKATDIRADGDFSDWPEQALWPTWHQRSDGLTDGVKMRMAWSEAGLWVGAEVSQSVLKTDNPRTFWAGDTIELWVDTADDKSHRFYEPGDHQFWILPQVEEKRAYVGRWKAKEEVPKSRYDLKGVESFAERTRDGYRLECLIPANAFDNYKPASGSKLGLAWVVTVHNEDKRIRHVFWPRYKDWGILNLPKTWATVVLD